MAEDCGCGEKAQFTNVTTSRGICRDCYKGLSREERSEWIARRGRMFGLLRT